MGRAHRNRLLPDEEDFRYDLQTILGDSIHMDTRRVMDRFLRYERVLGVRSNWTPLDFDGKRVLEIGCGPLLGLGPNAVYPGATEYVCVEPRYQAEVLKTDAVWTRFFLPLYQQLDAVFDRGTGFAEFVDNVRSGIRVDTIGIEHFARMDNPVDVIFSSSVLQHIDDLDQARALVRQVSHASTRQLHVVDFSDHFSPPDDPFREIYRQDPEEYFEYDSLLNLKRPSEIATLFREAGIPVEVIPYITGQTAINGTMAPYWSRFDASDLSVQIAFFVNQGFGTETWKEGDMRAASKYGRTRTQASEILNS